MVANLGKDEDEAELANATRGIPFNWHSRGMCPPPHCVHYRQSTNMQRTARKYAQRPTVRVAVAGTDACWREGVA